MVCYNTYTVSNNNKVFLIIMRSFKVRVWPIAGLCVAVFATPLLASAQQAAKDAPPPKMEKLEESEAPAVMIRKPSSEQKATEKREKGKVTQVKVQSGKSTYYLKPNDQPGSALPGDTESSTMRAPQWQVMEFDFTRRKDVKEADTGAALAPPPAAPASPEKK